MEYEIHYLMGKLPVHLLNYCGTHREDSEKSLLALRHSFTRKTFIDNLDIINENDLYYTID